MFVFTLQDQLWMMQRRVAALAPFHAAYCVACKRRKGQA